MSMLYIRIALKKTTMCVYEKTKFEMRRINIDSESLIQHDDTYELVDSEN